MSFIEILLTIIVAILSIHSFLTSKKWLEKIINDRIDEKLSVPSHQPTEIIPSPHFSPPLPEAVLKAEQPDFWNNPTALREASEKLNQNREFVIEGHGLDDKTNYEQIVAIETRLAELNY
jgi:hypothetical protein